MLRFGSTIGSGSQEWQEYNDIRILWKCVVQCSMFQGCHCDQEKIKIYPGML